jgi:cytochrome c1
MKAINFKEFVAQTKAIHKKNKQLRYGQVVMNLLWNVWPDKYKEVTSTDDDCFYNDNLAEKLLNKLEYDWPSFSAES